MKKLHFLWILLLAAALLMLGGCGTADTKATEENQASTEAEAKEPAKDTKGRIILSTKEELQYLHTYPDANFIVTANIDCDGDAWTPIEKFTGSITGVWGGIFNYTISKFVVEGGSLENVGFFGVNEGTVKHLNFKNVTVKAEKGAKNIGGVFGKAYGKIADVMIYNVSMDFVAENANIGAFSGYQEADAESIHADGEMKVKLSGSGSKAGGLFGVAMDVTECDSRVKLTVEDEGSENFIGGIAGTVSTCIHPDFSGELQISLKSPSSMAGEIAGRVLRYMEDADLGSRKTSYSVAGTEEKLHDVGTAEGAEVTGSLQRDLSTLDVLLPENEQALRKIVVDYMYEEVTIPWQATKNMEDETHYYNKGEWYFGLPYTHKCGSLERFKYYQNEDGSLKSTVPATSFDLMLGNDCCDACYWAWAQIDGDLSYRQTENMIMQNGIIAVGEMDLSNTNTTDFIVENTGEKAMYEAYALMKAGDGMLYASPNGHARMASEAAYVFRDENGEIVPDKSYVITYQQGGSKRKLPESHTTCGEGMKYTFTQLCDSNYIPITIPTFQKGVADESTAYMENTEEGLSGIGKGKIVSNYRINWVHAQIIDEGGTVVRDIIDYPTLNNHNVTYNMQTMRGELGVKSLNEGTYRYIVSVSGGQNDIVVQDMTFTK